MSTDNRAEPQGWMAVGTPDRQTVTADWLAVDPPAIDGVALKEIRPVATSNGYLTEIFREEWGLDPLPVGQVFQRTMYPGAVTGWHARRDSGQAVLFDRQRSHIAVRRPQGVADLRRGLAQDRRCGAAGHRHHSARRVARRRRARTGNGAGAQPRRQGLCLRESGPLAPAARH